MKLLKLVQRQAGVARRKAIKLIQEGRVQLDGQIVTNPFLEIDPQSVKELRVDGRPVPLEPPETLVLKLYKPRGMLSSLYDPHHEHTVGRLLKRRGLWGRGLVIAGRLDRDAEGLLVLTNDGELVNVLTHPRYQIEKVYRVVIPRALPPRHLGEVLRKMRRGVRDPETGELLTIKQGRVVRQGEGCTEVELVLTEGKKHEVKRLIKHFKLPLGGLKRVALGPVRLGSLKPYELVPVSPQERRALERLKRTSRSTTKACGPQIPNLKGGS